MPYWAITDTGQTETTNMAKVGNCDPQVQSGLGKLVIHCGLDLETGPMWRRQGTSFAEGCLASRELLYGRPCLDITPASLPSLMCSPITSSNCSTTTCKWPPCKLNQLLWQKMQDKHPMALITHVLLVTSSIHSFILENLFNAYWFLAKMRPSVLTPWLNWKPQSILTTSDYLGWWLQCSCNDYEPWQFPAACC